MRRLNGNWFTGRLARAVGATAVMTGVAIAAATVAQASWTPATTLTPHGWEGVGPVVSASAKGTFVTAWEGFSNTKPNCDGVIQVRLRSSAGKWGSVHQLTPCPGPNMVFPAVASNAAGYSVVAWLQVSDNAIQAVTISPTGKIGRVLTVTPKDNQAYYPFVAVSPTGQALVVWESMGPSGILARFLTGNTLGPVRSLGASTLAVSSPVFDKTGTATVAFTATQVYAVRFTAKHVGPRSVILNPSGAGAYGTPQLADDRNGDTFVLASLTTATKTRQIEHLVVRRWSKERRLGKAITVAKANPTVTTTNVADGPALAADGAGDAVVVWPSGITNTKAAVFGRRLSHTGSLGPAVRLGTGYLPHIVISPAGFGLITWQSTQFQSGLVTTIYGRHVTATKGTFGRLIKFTADGAHAALAVDNAGRSAVIWERSPLVQARVGA